jgi:hypothetical protein
MRIDTYTKIVLTVIALALAVVAFKPLVEPQAVAAQGPLAGLRVFGTNGGFYVVDEMRGDFWLYGLGFTGKAAKYLGKMTRPGEPLNK